MRRRKKIFGVALFSAIIGCCLLCIAGLRSRVHRSERIILIVADALRADHVGCYGAPGNPTPNIDALAERSIRFTDCYSVAPWTWPSAAAMMTGRYPSESLVFPHDSKFLGYLARRPRTLAGIMQDRGFTTAAFSASRAFAPTFGFGRGFSTFPDFRNDRDAVRAAARWVSKHRNRKFFAILWLMSTHHPYHAADMPPSLRRQVSAARPCIRTGAIFGRHGLYSTAQITAHPRNDEEYSPAEIRLLHQMYEAGIHQVDRYIGHLLKATDGIPRTAILVTADHGEEWLEHGDIGHKLKLYAVNLHVPLIVHAPGYAARIQTAPVTNLDLMPTILALARIRPQTDLPGLALCSQRSIPRDRIIISEVGVAGWRVHRCSAHDDSYLVIHTLTAPPREPVVPRGGRWEYVTHGGRRATSAPDLRRALLAHESVAKRQVRATKSRPLDAKTKAELEALGYIAK